MQLFSLILCTHAAFCWEVNHALAQAIAEADRLDPGWRCEQLEAKRGKLPDAQNGTLQIFAIGKALKGWTFFSKTLRFPNERKLPPKQREKLVFDFDMALGELPPQVRLNEQQTRALAAEIEELARVVTLARDLNRFSRGRYPFPPDASLFTFNDSLAQARRACTLLGYDAWLHAERGRPSEALKSCQAILAAGSIIGDEVDQLAHIVRVALRHMACANLERILAQGEPNPKDLHTMQQALEREASVNLLLHCARADRAFLHRVFSDFKTRKIKREEFESFEGVVSSLVLAVEPIPPRPPPEISPSQRAMAWHTCSLERAWAALLREENVFVEAAKLPLHKVPAKLREITTPRKYIVHLGLLHTCGVHGLLATAARRDHMRLQTARVGMALERYRQKHGRWPQKLDDLVPDFLSEIPIDVFTSQSVRYHHLDDGVAVYAVVGAKDDGGRLRPAPGQGWSVNELDIGFRLWNVTARRQAPLPPLRIPGKN